MWFLALSVACAPPPPTTGGEPVSEPTAAVPTEAFVDRVWRVTSSSAVAPGTLYSFHADGTLVVRAGDDPPGVGEWTYDDGRLTMIEEGVAYPVEILALDAHQFRIRSHNPGEPVTIDLEPAPDVPLESQLAAPLAPPQ